MAYVAALYRYPVKGLTPERRDSLQVMPDGRIAGDRVLGFRFADTPAGDDQWSPKQGMLVLMNTPGLARLRVAWDEQSRRLRIEHEGGILADESIDDELGRSRIAAAVQDYALKLEVSPLRDDASRLPLRLVGDGVTPRYHDVAAGEVSLHGRGSLAALAQALGAEEVDETRFRSNIAVEGLGAWEELAWAGRQVRIGELTFRVSRPKTRCLATHANPASGERDLPILTTLTRAFAQEQPTFAISLSARSAGTLRVGDEVEVLA